MLNPGDEEVSVFFSGCKERRLGESGIPGLEILQDSESSIHPDAATMGFIGRFVSGERGSMKERRSMLPRSQRPVQTISLTAEGAIRKSLISGNRLAF